MNTDVNETIEQAADVGQEANLAGVTVKLLGCMKKAALVRLCEFEGLPANGKRADILQRLKAKKFGGARGYVPGQTLCRHCGAIVRVQNTIRSEMYDGRILVTRFVRCCGRRRHAYPIREIIGLDV